MRDSFPRLIELPQSTDGPLFIIGQFICSSFNAADRSFSQPRLIRRWTKLAAREDNLIASRRFVAHYICLTRSRILAVVVVVASEGNSARRTHIK